MDFLHAKYKARPDYVIWWHYCTVLITYTVTNKEFLKLLLSTIYSIIVSNTMGNSNLLLDSVSSFMRRQEQHPSFRQQPAWWHHDDISVLQQGARFMHCHCCMCVQWSWSWNGMGKTLSEHCTLLLHFFKPICFRPEMLVISHHCIYIIVGTSITCFRPENVSYK